MEEDLEEFAADQILAKASMESMSAKGDSSAAGTPPEASPSLPDEPSNDSPLGSSHPGVDAVREESPPAGTLREALFPLQDVPSDEDLPGSSPPRVDAVREESLPAGTHHDVLSEMNYTVEMFESSQPTAQSEPSSSQIGRVDLSESDAPSLTGHDEEDDEVTLSALQLQSPLKRPNPDADASGSPSSNKKTRK